jgi:hypothetical protein
MVLGDNRASPSFAPRAFVARTIGIIALCASPGASPAQAGTSLLPDGLLLVDGKVMYPIGLIEIGSDKYSDWNDRIRRSKANFVWDIDRAYLNDAPTCAALVDSAEATGYALLIGSGDTWNWDDPDTPELEVDRYMYEPDELSELLSCVGSSPSVAAFANRDEPGWVISRDMVGDIDAPHVHETYAQLHGAIPNAIVAMNHAPTHLSGDLQAWKDEVISFRDATDVTMFASYPYPAGLGTCTAWNVLGYPECPMDRLAVGADIFRLELNKPGQPLWMIIQAFKNIPLKEARWEAYASIIHGAKGIFWAGWNWTHVLGGGEQNWPVIEQVIQEIASFHPFLVANDVSGIVTDNPNVEACAKRLSNRKTAVFAISRNAFAGDAAIFLPGVRNGRVFLPHEGNRAIDAQDGWIVDHFEAYEGHAYHYTASEVVQDQATDAEVSVSSIDRFSVQASPNPSSGPTRAQFALPHDASVTLTVYDASGRKVAVAGSGTFTSGRHDLHWNGLDARGHAVAPGLYFIRGETTRGESATAKVLIRR